MWIDKIFRSAENLINGAIDSSRPGDEPDKESALAIGPDGKALSDKQMAQQLNLAIDELQECLDNLENLDSTTGGKL